MQENEPVAFFKLKDAIRAYANLADPNVSKAALYLNELFLKAEQEFKEMKIDVATKAMKMMVKLGDDQTTTQFYVDGFCYKVSVLKEKDKK